MFVEINKRHFIDTKTFRKTDGFAAIQASVEALTRRVVEHSRGRRDRRGDGSERVAGRSISR